MFRMPAPRTSAEITAKPDCRSALFQGPSLQYPKNGCVQHVLVSYWWFWEQESHSSFLHPIHWTRAISCNPPIRSSITSMPVAIAFHSKTYFDIFNCQGTPDLLWSARDIDRTLSTMVSNNGMKGREPYYFNSTDIMKRRVFWRRHHVPRGKKSQGSPRFTSSRKGQRISQALQ